MSKFQERLLKDEDREIIREEYWSRLVDDVELIYISNSDPYCQYCQVIKQLYTELTELTDKVLLREFLIEENPNLSVEYEVEYFPVTILKGKNRGLIKFYGIPAGQEFPSFLEAIVMLSTGDHGLSDNLVAKIKEISKKVVIRTFVTPSCPYCPKMVFTTYQFAFINDFISAEGWEITEFPSISEKYDIVAVPKIVVNDRISWEGLVTPEYLLEKIFEAII